MSDLVEFLLARITEDEATAHEATENFPVVEPWPEHGYVAVDPHRVLAECAAKRRLVAEYEAAAHARDSAPADPHPWLAFQTAVTALWPALAMFAAVYADHDDYRDEWRP